MNKMNQHLLINVYRVGSLLNIRDVDIGSKGGFKGLRVLGTTMISVSLRTILRTDESDLLIVRCIKNRALFAARSVMNLLFCSLLNAEYECHRAHYRMVAINIRRATPFLMPIVVCSLVNSNCSHALVGSKE